MLGTLVRSFTASAHDVLYPSREVVLEYGTLRRCDDFGQAISDLADECDAGLVIAPDELLGGYIKLIEKSVCRNLGCSSGSASLCADKLLTTRALAEHGVPVPRTAGFGETLECGLYVIKPRFGCASEGIRVTGEMNPGEGEIATEFIDGEHLSASLILGKSPLPLTVNRQLIHVNNTISYEGGDVPYRTRRWDEVMGVAIRTAKILGCSGYVGVDMVLADKPYVVDVNPRPTTSIVGIEHVIDRRLGDLLIRAQFGGLPGAVNIRGSFRFTKETLTGEKLAGL
ncbi:MAG TPA: ATP-grasp domain-containing protein [Candidatus Methanoperedenaceae archaeon]|nr:ATP-grasp domain-containing protein [Candidatus Methanoperedenaceae archaeon]